MKKNPITRGALAIVVGAGRSGRGAARLLHSMGARVRVLERNAENIADFQEWAQGAGVEIVCGEHKPEHFAGSALLIPSPGVPIASLEAFLPVKKRPIIMAELELAWRMCGDIPTIAVTGTSGKTTTVSLCAAMLRAGGRRVFLGGNIGTPLSEFVLSGEQADVLVLELSSFQLQTCVDFVPDIAMILNISENHLDYHADMQEYVDAKFRIFQNQSVYKIAIMGAGLREYADNYDLQARTVFFEPCDRFPTLALFGAHNQANAEAAWIAARAMGISLADATRAAEEFAPLEHRLERVAEKQGVLYVNDSKATTVEALHVALSAFDRPLFLLAGGKFKGGDLASLRELLQQHVRHVALFGASRSYFEDAWQDCVPMSWDATLTEAMARLQSQVQTGDVVLLSPATASFDLYKNYEERGHDFKRIVEAL